MYFFEFQVVGYNKAFQIFFSALMEVKTDLSIKHAIINYGNGKIDILIRLF